MGTRADFYVGRGKNAEWLGSIAWDGYPDGIDSLLLRCRSEEAWRTLVAEYIAGRDDGTKPEDGWPWPWKDSATTDYAYAFDEGRVWASAFGTAWFKADEPEPEVERSGDGVTFPDMSARKNVQMGSKRSGVVVFRA